MTAIPKSLAASTDGYVRKIYTSTLTKDNIDEVNFTASPTITTMEPDRDGEVVLPEAILEDLDDYLASPKFLWGHRREGNPEETLGQCLELQPIEKGWKAKFGFDVDINKRAELVWKQTVKGSQRGYSICFLPISWVTLKSPKADIQALPLIVQKWLYSGACKTVYTRVEIIEISAVHVQSNRKSVLKSVGEIKEGPVKVKDKAGASISAGNHEILKKAMGHSEASVRACVKAMAHINALCKSAGADDLMPADFPAVELDVDDEDDKDEEEKAKSKSVSGRLASTVSKAHLLTNDVCSRLRGVAYSLEGCTWEEYKEEGLPPQPRLEAAVAVLASILSQVQAMVQAAPTEAKEAAEEAAPVVISMATKEAPVDKAVEATQPVAEEPVPEPVAKGVSSSKFDPVDYLYGLIQN